MAIFSVALYHAYLWLHPQMCFDSNRFPFEGAEKQVLVNVYTHPRAAQNTLVCGYAEALYSGDP